MYVLVAKILAPVVVFCTTVVSEWSRLRDASTRRQAIRRVTMGAAVAVAVSAGLVVDHGNQTAAVATAQEDAAEAQAARQSIQESLDEQDADLSAARGSSRKRKSHSVASKAGRKKPWPSCGSGIRALHNRRRWLASSKNYASCGSDPPIMRTSSPV